MDVKFLVDKHYEYLQVGRLVSYRPGVHANEDTQHSKGDLTFLKAARSLWKNQSTDL